MRRTLRNLRNIHGYWVRRRRRCVRRLPVQWFGCRNHVGWLPADSIPSGEIARGKISSRETMADLRCGTIASMVLSRLFFFLLPEPRILVQKLLIRRLCPQPIACRGLRVVLNADR